MKSENSKMSVTFKFFHLYALIIQSLIKYFFTKWYLVNNKRKIKI